MPPLHREHLLSRGPLHLVVPGEPGEAAYLVQTQQNKTDTINFRQLGEHKGEKFGHCLLASILKTQMHFFFHLFMARKECLEGGQHNPGSPQPGDISH